MRCVIYLRVSTRGQAEKGEGEEGFSIPAQREACARHIRDAGWDLVDEYADRGESARSAERPQLQAMLARIATERDVDAVVVHKIDRLARNMEDHVAIRALLRRRDVALVSVTENVEETASGRLVEGIHALMAEFYSANLAAEIKKGMVQKAKLGGFPHGAPIGYLNVKEIVGGRQVARIVPDPDRAPLVTLGFEHYASGDWILQRLAGELGHQGLTNRGRRDRPVKAITWQGLAKILANPIYTGIVCWGGVEHPGLHQPLTTPDTFRRVQELLAARSVRGTRERKHPHYLKGLLHCGVCGRRLSIQHSKGRYTYFFCLGQKNDPAGTCRERYIAADDLEAQVEQLYTAIQLSASWAERLEEELHAEVIERQHADAAQRELLTRRVAKAETERRKLLNAYYSGAIDVPTLKVEQPRIGADLTAAQDRLVDLDANLSEWQEILELAATFATRCGDAYRKASDPIRGSLNVAVFERPDVKDGRICHEEYRPPFDDIFNVPEFDCGTRERATGIEPALPAWKAGTLPLSYARDRPMLADGRSELRWCKGVEGVITLEPPEEQSRSSHRLLLERDGSVRHRRVERAPPGAKQGGTAGLCLVPASGGVRDLMRRERVMWEPVPSDADFRTLEAGVAGFWEAEAVFQRSIAEREGAEPFVFYEGPPTANGRPGLHHVWARIYKDLFCRFQTMRGRRVERRAGWDTHGLPVEVQVERELGFSGKPEIEAYGIASFVERCRESVYTYVEEWSVLTKRIGYWVDLDDAYWTLSPSYIQSVWWHLRQLFDKGLLYEDVKVVPYCPRCGTALSSHELGQEDVYRDIEDLAAYVRFPVLSGAPGGAAWIVVWTTTPWTLPSNVAVAVATEMSYVVVDQMVVAADRADAVFGEGARARATAEITGADLLGVRYRPPFDLAEQAEGGRDGWRVVGGSFVTAEEGSGLVHIAPAFGADDWLLGREEGLPTINPVGADGCFVDGTGFLAGRPVRSTNEEILERLAASDLVVRADLHEHSYPHCWRCKTPLIYWGKPSWYVATSTEREALLQANETVNWRPEHIKEGRFGQWLANNVDWALSRDRYWGTPLPIWTCESRHVVCVASLEELSELAGTDLSSIDPHRPGIDEVTFSCRVCGEEARRVPAVIDAWFDSGSMPAAGVGYPADPGSAERFAFPADFITEGIDQTRGWFYSLLAVNVLVHGRAPYRNVLALGHIVDESGKKMSKSIGNIIDPWTVLDTRGADPLRWWMFHQGSPWTPTRTSLELIDSSTSDVLLTLWNTWSFLTTYAALNGFDPTAPVAPARERTVLDRWLASRVAATVEVVTGALEEYYPLQAATALGELIDDLSNWYVRRSRRRFWRTDPAAPPEDSAMAQATLYEALVTVAKLLAPFCPFLAEAIWRHLTAAGRAESVHLAPWPVAEVSAIDPVLESEMTLARQVVSLGRAARAQAGVKVRQPLRQALVVLPPGSPALLSAIVAEELNVDTVVLSDGLSEVFSFELVPNFRLVGPRLGGAARGLRQALAELDSQRAAETLAAGDGITVILGGVEVELGAAEVEVRVTPREGFAASREGAAAVALDLQLDDGLRHRGLVRDVVRQLQEIRRSIGLEVSDRITVHIAGLDELRSAAEEIVAEVLAVEVDFCEGEGPSFPLEVDSGVSARAWVEKFV